MDTIGICGGLDPQDFCIRILLNTFGFSLSNRTHKTDLGFNAMTLFNGSYFIESME